MNLATQRVVPQLSADILEFLVAKVREHHPQGPDRGPQDDGALYLDAV